ncbi:MAG TPA: autotransporter-associated beta strand repeat-containing protein [Tepidisphaeraceae bacterium]|jgi:autotransporter-associated beta strand protein|nr:autotransporter-associated beta strand repeat-containing protein [Tepidisphaeraceae bacterium]
MQLSMPPLRALSDPRAKLVRAAGKAALALLCCSGLALFSNGSGASAATLTWDPSQTPATPSGGTGTWDLNTTPDWSNGTADVDWTDNSAIGIDSAVFGATGGTVSLNSNLSASGVQFTGSGYAISGTGVLSIGTGGINASSLNTGTTSIANSIALVGGMQTWNVGSGSTLNVGAITRTAGSGTTVQFIPSGAISTTTANTAGDILGGWATVGTTATTLDWATSAGTGSVTGPITAFSNYTTNIATATSSSDFMGTGTLSGDLTINSLIETGDIHLVGHKLTVASGGIVFQGANFWMQDAGGILTTGLPSGELFVHSPNASLNDQQIFVSIQDNGATPLILEKDGPGTLYITGPNNTYSGGTIVNGGTLSLKSSASGHTGSMGSANAPLTVNSGATLDINSVSTGISLLSGTGGTITSSSGTPTFTVGNTNATGETWPGSITGTLGLTKTGTGTLTLTGFNSYTGGTIINGGSLKLTAGNNGNGAVRGVITVNSGGTLIVGGHDVFGYNSAAVSVNTININGGTLDDQNPANNNETATGITINMTGGTISATGGGYFQSFSNGYGDTTINTLASPTTATISSRLDLRQASKNLTFTVAAGSAPGGVDLLDSGTISESTGGSGITKVGPGLMSMTATASYTGNTTINGGTLQLNTGNAGAGQLAGTPSIIVNNGGTLALNAGDVLGYTVGKEAIVINSGGTVSDIGTGSRVTLWNDVNMTGGTLTGTATSGDANGSFSLNTQVVATSDANGVPAVINAPKISFQGQNNANYSEIFNVTRGSASPASDLNVSSVIVSQSANTGMTKTGNGVMTLSGSNLYTGPTTVSSGVLLVNNTAGSGTGTNTVTVATGGTLGGKGAISGATTIQSGGTLAPSGIATTPIGGPLKITGAVAFTDNTSNFTVNLASTTPGTGYDQVQYGSTLALSNATLTVNDAGYTPKMNDVFYIADAAAGNVSSADQVSGQFNGIPNGGTYISAAGINYQVAYNGPATDPNATGNYVQLTVTQIPEPSSLTLLAACSLGLLTRRRRARRVLPQ